MSHYANEKRPDIHRVITEKIIDAIKEGPGGFEMPWHRFKGRIERPQNAHTAKSYRGVNVVALWVEALAKNYPSGYWASYHQWQSLGAQVRRGERGSLILFYKPLVNDRKERSDGERGEHEDGETVRPRRRFIARGSTVFNASQVDGWSPQEPERTNNVQRIERIEALVASTKANIREGHYDMACYDSAVDLIDMPKRSLFKGSRTSTPTEAFYATLFHELTHNAVTGIMPHGAETRRLSV